MGDINLILRVVEWQRGLDDAAGRRQQHRPDEPYVNYLAAAQPAAPRPRRQGPPSLFARLLACRTFFTHRAPGALHRQG